MSKRNDKQRTTRENYWEAKKNLWTNQEKPMRTIEKPMDNQRRNNEKQWKTKDNYASILFFLQGFLLLFFRIFHLQWWTKIRDILKEKMMPVWGALDLVCSQNPVNMQ